MRQTGAIARKKKSEDYWGFVMDTYGVFGRQEMTDYSTTTLFNNKMMQPTKVADIIISTMYTSVKYRRKTRRLVERIGVIGVLILL